MKRLVQRARVALGGTAWPLTITTKNTTWCMIHLEWTNAWGVREPLILQRREDTSFATPNFDLPQSWENYRWLGQGPSVTRYKNLFPYTDAGKTFYYRITAVLNWPAVLKNGATPVLGDWLTGKGTLDSLPGGWVNIDATDAPYSVVADDATNNWAGIRAAATAANAAGGGVVQLPAGTIRCWPTDTDPAWDGTYLSMDPGDTAADNFLEGQLSNVVLQGTVDSQGEITTTLNMRLWTDKDAKNYLVVLNTPGGDPGDDNDIDTIRRYTFWRVGDSGVDVENVALMKLKIDMTGDPVNTGKQPASWGLDGARYQWDTTHKVVASFNNARNIYIEDVETLNARGEHIYSGGFGTEKVVMNRVTLRRSNSSITSGSWDVEYIDVYAADAANALVESNAHSLNNDDSGVQLTSAFTGYDMFHDTIGCRFTGRCFDQSSDGVMKDLPGEREFSGIQQFNQKDTFQSWTDCEVRDIWKYGYAPWYEAEDVFVTRMDLYNGAREDAIFLDFRPGAQALNKLSGGMDNTWLCGVTLNLEQDVGNGGRLVAFSGSLTLDEVMFEQIHLNGNGFVARRVWFDNYSGTRTNFTCKDWTQSNAGTDALNMIIDNTASSQTDVGSRQLPVFTDVDFFDHRRTVTTTVSGCRLQWNRNRIKNTDTDTIFDVSVVNTSLLPVGGLFYITPDDPATTIRLPAATWNTWTSTVSVLYGTWLEMTVVLDGGVRKLDADVTSEAGYYVSSSSGNDSNTGLSPAQAWASLAKVNATTLVPGDNVFFKRGDTWEGTVSVTDSGTPGNPITFGAYGTGDKPRIYGSETLTGWTVHSGSIYKATLTTSPTQVFQNGTRLQQARWPTAVQEAEIDSVNSQTSFVDAALPTGYSHAGATVLIKSSDYVYEKRTVASSSGSNFTISNSTQFRVYPGSGYILMGKLNYLSKAGQWHYDAGSNTLYVWATDGADPDTHTMRVSTTDYGFYLATGVTRVTLENLGLYHQARNCVNAKNCSWITVDGNEMIYPDGNGFSNFDFSSVANDCVISNNTIMGANHQGVWGWGDRWTIEGNTIRQIGRTANLSATGSGWSLGGAAVAIWRSDGYLYFRYNTIENCGWNATYFYDCPDTTVEYNLIKNVCLDRNDVGGIYHDGGGSWASTETSERGICRYNIVHNVGGTLIGSKTGSPAGAAIYLDNYARDWTVEYNTVINSWGGGIFAHWGGGHTIRYNTVFDGGIKSLEDDGQNQASTWQYNTVYCLSSDADSGQTQRCAHATRQIGTNFDYNTYINHYDTDCFRTPSGLPLVSFATWKAHPAIDDANSTFDGSTLPGGHTEGILYNASSGPITVNLGGKTFYDLNGDAVTGTVSVSAWGNIILTGVTADFDSIVTNGATLVQP